MMHLIYVLLGRSAYTPDCGRVLSDSAMPANMVDGSVRWDPIKSIWLSLMSVFGIVGAVFCFTWSGFVLSATSTAVLVLLGHSIGMHRLLIHESFKCSKWLEYTLVYLGVLMGMGGTLSMARVHDARDFAQRLPRAHDYFTHRRAPWIDAWWQLHCRFEPVGGYPTFETEKRIAADRLYVFLQRTWMLHQVPLAVLFFAISGWSGVLIAVCGRVAAGIVGHWLVTFIVHRTGRMPFEIEGACVQGHNNLACAVITAGESLHSNHHAYPGSAKYGLHRGELDPGWWALCLFERTGLTWGLKTPDDLPPRAELKIRAGEPSANI
jgi:fatty-acid desaturase